MNNEILRSSYYCHWKIIIGRFFRTFNDAPIVPSNRNNHLKVLTFEAVLKKNGVRIMPNGGFRNQDSFRVR